METVYSDDWKNPHLSSQLSKHPPLLPHVHIWYHYEQNTTVSKKLNGWTHKQMCEPSFFLHTVKPVLFLLYQWILQMSTVLFCSLLFYTIIRRCRKPGWGVINTHRTLQVVVLFCAGHQHLILFSQYLLKTTLHLKSSWLKMNPGELI